MLTFNGRIITRKQLAIAALVEILLYGAMFACGWFLGGA